MIRRRLLVAALVGSVLAACGQAEPSASTRPDASGRTASPSGPTASAAPSSALPAIEPSPEPIDPADAWAHVTAGIERDGTVPLQTALEGFALLVGPLPGVDTPAGDPPDFADGAVAISMLLGHWDELTRAQQDAAEALLTPEPSTASLTSGPLTAALGVPPTVAVTNPCPGGRDSPRKDEFETLIPQAIATVESQLGRKLKLPVSVIFHGVGNVTANIVPLDKDCKLTRAEARPAACQIQFTNRGEGLNGFELTHLVHHEVFHCFQLDFATSAAAENRVSRWLAEGAAAWVGESISGNSTMGAEYWESWLRYPGQPLFQRTYDGIGFFMHLQDVGLDPWKVLVPMHLKAETSSADAYAVAVKAASAKLLDAWGPSYIRDVSLRPDWSTDGPGLPGYVTTPIPAVELTDNTTIVGGADPLTALAARIDLRSEAVVFEPLFVTSGTHGLIRFSDGTQQTMADAASKPFCLKSGGCVCPEGSAGAGHAWQSGSSGQLLLGIAGHTDGLDLEIQAMSVDVTCAQAPEDFVPEEPCWCPPGPLGRHDLDRSTETASTGSPRRRRTT